MSGTMQNEANKAGLAMNQSLQNGAQTAKNTTVKMATDIKQSLTSARLDTVAGQEGSKMSNRLESGIRSGAGGARSATRNLADTAIGTLQGAGMHSAAYSVGVNFGDGLAAGIASTVNRIASEAAATVRSAINAANAAQDAHSPARKAKPIGHNFDEGIAVGIEDKRPEVEAEAAKTMAAALDVSTKKSLINQAKTAMDNALTKSWNVQRTLNARSTPAADVYAAVLSALRDESSSGPDLELIKAIEHLANRPVYTDLYIGPRKFAEATAQDMTQVQQQEVKLKKMINGVKSA